MYASEPNRQGDVVSHRLLGDWGGETMSSYRFSKIEPRIYQELKAAIPRNLHYYTPEQDAAVRKGVDDYGLDFERIKDENKDLFEG